MSFRTGSEHNQPGANVHLIAVSLVLLYYNSILLLYFHIHIRADNPDKLGPNVGSVVNHLFNNQLTNGAKDPKNVINIMHM